MTFTQAQRHVDLRLEQPLSVFDTAIEWVFAVALIFAPLAYGATNAWSQQLLYSMIAGAGLLLGCKLMFVRGSRLVWAWAYVPIVLYLLLVTLSLIPLPASFVHLISPGTVEEKSKLLADLPDAASRLAKVTITFNAWTTRRGLRMVLAMSVVFTVIVNVYRTPAQIKRLLGTMAAAGAFVIVIALLQDFSHSPGEKYRIFWNLPYVSADAVHPNAGPFAGHSQFGQYVNLAVGAMLALACVFVGQAFAGENPTPRELFERFGETPMRLTVLLAIGILLAAVAQVLAVSRGALVGFGVAAVVAAALVVYKRGRRKNETAASLIVLAGVVLAMVVGYVMVVEPLLAARTSTTEQSGDIRMQILSNMRPMFKTWPLMGSGLESFEWVFPLFYKLKLQPNLYDHAENDYAQTLSDTGVIGAAITAAFIAMILLQLGKAMRRRETIDLAAVGIAFGLVAVMMHSASDFSQRTPAVALESAALIGLLFALPLGRAVKGTSSPRGDASRGTVPQAVFGWSPVAGGAFTLVLCAAMGWSIFSLNGVRLAEYFAYESDPTASTLDVKQDSPTFTTEVAAYFADPIDGDIKAIQYDPLYVRYPRELNHFRWREMSARRDPKTTAIIYPPGAAAMAQPMVEQLTAARVLCPSYGRLFTIMGKLQYDLLDKQQGLKNLQTAQTLMPTDGEAALFLAQAAADSGDWTTAAAEGQRCFDINPQFQDQLLDLFVKRYAQPEIAMQIMSKSSYALGTLADRLGDDQAELRSQIRKQVIALLQDDVNKFPQATNMLGALAGRQLEAGDRASAIENFQRVVAIDYGDIGTRLTLARLLLQAGQRDQAAKQVDVVLSLQRDQPDAKALRDQLNAPPPRPAP